LTTFEINYKNNRKHCYWNGYLVKLAVVNTVPAPSLMIVVTKKVCINNKENL